MSDSDISDTTSFSGSDDSDSDSSDDTASVCSDKVSGSEAELLDSMLPDDFRERESKMEISEWALTDLRAFILGQPVSKDERKNLTEKYYVNPEVYALFQTTKLTSSPLTMLKFEGSTASRDISFIHSEVRIYPILFLLIVCLLCFR